jgi:hypothetical protein
MLLKKKKDNIEKKKTDKGFAPIFTGHEPVMLLLQ